MDSWCMMFCHCCETLDSSGLFSYQDGSSRHAWEVSGPQEKSYNPIGARFVGGHIGQMNEKDGPNMSRQNGCVCWILSQGRTRVLPFATHQTIDHKPNFSSGLAWLLNRLKLHLPLPSDISVHVPKLVLSAGCSRRTMHQQPWWIWCFTTWYLTSGPQ